MKYISSNIEPGYMSWYSHTPSSTARSAYFYVQSVGHFYCEKDYIIQRKGHRSYLLIYTLRGKGHALYRGKWYELSKNKILLMNCYDYQEYFTDKKELWEMKWIHFNGGGSEGYFNVLYENSGPVIDVGEVNSIPGYIDSIIELVRQNDNKLEIKSSGIIAQMLTDLMLAASSQEDGDGDTRISASVVGAQDFVENNYNSGITLKDMARAACCSVFHFSRVFRKATGYSPYEYLIKYRINKAKTLLKTTGRTIDDIAADVGFKSTSNFIKTFRELEDMTPLKYRKFWTG